MQLSSFQNLAKTIGLVAVLAIVLVASIVLGKNFSNYLAKASTCQVQKVAASGVNTNSAVISWETVEDTLGRVEYGTSANSLTFTAPEATTGKVHNVPLTLLTPNTSYYYLIAIGDTRCDSSGQSCTGNCVPYNFTTVALTPPANTEVTMTPVVTLPAVSPTSSVVPPSVVPTEALSSFCQKVKTNIGASSQDTVKWPSAKQYDIDANGVINGLDVVKCKQAGK